MFGAAPGEHGRDCRAIFVLEVARIGRDAAVDRRLQPLVDLEQLGDEAPVPVEPFGHAPRALLGPVAEPDRPLGRKFPVIGDFLHRLVRELDQEAVARLRQPLQQHVLPGRIEQVPRDRLGEVAVRLLDQQAIAEVEHVPVKRELIAITGFAEQQSRLADQVQRKVGETDVHLEHRAVPAPFAQALPEDERVVAEAQEVFGAGIDGERRHQMCFTSSGMS